MDFASKTWELTSSHSHLLLLNPIFTKVDQMFVRSPYQNTHKVSPLETFFSLGNQLVMAILAEGIETRGQIERLRGLGCEFGQGVFHSAAVPTCQLAALNRAPGSKYEPRVQRLLRLDYFTGPLFASIQIQRASTSRFSRT